MRQETVHSPPAEDRMQAWVRMGSNSCRDRDPAAMCSRVLAATAEDASSHCMVLRAHA